MAVLRRFDSSIFQYFLFVLFMTPLSGRKVSRRSCAGVLEQLMSAPIYTFEGFLQWRAEFQSSVSIFSTVFYCLLREVERRHDVIYLVCTSYLDAKVARISMRCWYLGVRNVFPVGSCIFPIFGVVCVETHRAFNPEKSYFIFAQNPLIYTFLHQNYYMYHLNVKKRKILPGFSLLYFGEFFRGKYTTGNAEQLWKLICSGNYAMCYLSRGDCWRLIQVLLEVCTHARFKFRSLTSSD